MSANLDWLKMVQNSNGGPLPLVNDTTLDPALNQQAQQRQFSGLATTAQDTGTGWDFTPTPAAWQSVDYANPGGASTSAAASPAGSNAFGYTYSNPGAGWDPWGTYEGGNSYRGADGAGLYNVNADTKKGWGPNGQGEFDRDRVWRMTLDAARAEKLDPGAQDPQTQARVQQLYLDQIARLHRDYDNTPGLGAQAWANSAFAGYDKLAGGTGGATQTTGTRGGDGQTGGNGVNPPIPPYGQGQAAGANGQGQQPSPAAANPPAGGPLPPGYTNAPTYANPNPQVDPNALGGGTGGIDQLYQKDQAYRTAQLLQALGLGDINSRMSYGGSVIARQAPGLFEAWREAQGVGGQGVNGIGQTGAFANIYNSPGALGNFAQAGQHGLDWLLGQGQQGMSDQELIPLMQAFQELTGINQSDTQQRFRSNLTDQGLGQFLQSIGPNNTTSRLVPYLQSNPLFGFLTGKH